MSADKAVVLKNNRGHTMRLDPRMTLKELLKIGMIDLKIVKPETPLPDGWWKSVPEKRAKKETTT